MGKESKKVIIGIVAKHREEDKDLIRQDSRIRDEVKQAIFDNGGTAIGILSPNEKVQMAGDDWLIYDKFLDKKNIIKQIELCDGIILQGGNTNESYEPFIARYCYENNIPCLGICAGQNSVARALNGTIGKVKNPEKHDSSFDNYVHPIFVNKNSKFYQIIKAKETMVNSRHRRFVEKCPKLDKVGFCDDNYPDVIESKNKKFYIGVRFHPESLYKKDDKMNNIFKEFIVSCRKND